MHPRIFTIPIGGGIPIHSYGVMLGTSFIVAWFLVNHLARKDRLPVEKIGTLFIITAVSAVAGSRLLFVITNLDQFSSFGQIFLINQGGLVAYGGFLGGLAGTLVYCHVHKISVLAWADVAVFGVAIGLALTRIGCFLFGCDYGRVSFDLGIAVQFPEGSPAWLHHYARASMEGIVSDPSMAGLWGMENHVPYSSFSDPIHPAQIYSSLNGWISVGVLLIARRYLRKFAGQLFLIFFGYYAVTRFMLEFVRDDLQRGYVGPFTTSQFIAIVSLTLVVAGYVFLQRRASGFPDRSRPWEGSTEPAAAREERGKRARSSTPSGTKTRTSRKRGRKRRSR